MVTLRVRQVCQGSNLRYGELQRYPAVATLPCQLGGLVDDFHGSVSHSVNRHSVAQPCSEVEMRGHVANLIGLADRSIKFKGGRPHIAVNASDDAQLSLGPGF